MSKNNYEKYENQLQELRDIIYTDLGIATPETDYIESDIFEKAYHSPSEKCNLITRYFEDDKYVRAYAVKAFGEGIMIIFDKTLNSYNIIVLTEDDGYWYPTDYYSGITMLKSTFISLLTEAISIFNSNFNSEKYNNLCYF